MEAHRHEFYVLTVLMQWLFFCRGSCCASCFYFSARSVVMYCNEIKNCESLRTFSYCTNEYVRKKMESKKPIRQTATLFFTQFIHYYFSYDIDALYGVKRKVP